ncbi:MAG TPA: SRPBCC family protein, partial [Acidimicrobiales bacterium]|nr:SRPBCC family protein [Acidimicrobiales bacterium]
IRARASITVNAPPDQVYAAWRAFEELPRFMAHLESVQERDSRHSHWVAKAPAGRTVEWDAELVDDVPGKVISWRSAEGADVPNRGSVRFSEAPGPRGTEVSVDLRYEPPFGAPAAAVARIFGEDPLQQAKDDLRRFKQVVETGEVVRSEGSPEGSRIHRQLHQHEGQPLPGGESRQ